MNNRTKDFGWALILTPPVIFLPLVYASVFAPQLLFDRENFLAFVGLIIFPIAIGIFILRNSKA